MNEELEELQDRIKEAVKLAYQLGHRDGLREATDIMSGALDDAE